MAKLARGFILLSLVLATACASLPEGTERSEHDPWERYNRAMYTFNDAVDQAVLRPTAKGYRAVTPDFLEHGISNFFSNLSYPVVIVNQFLQGDFGDGLRDTGRFAINTVLGIGGLFDPATGMGLEANNEDFGQTLGVWGVSDGPYLVLPFLGPSTVRDTAGSYIDSEINPMFEYFEEPDRYYLLALRIVDLRAQLLDLDAQLQTTYDPYTFMRDAYLQRREYLVNDGKVEQQDYYDDIYDDFEDFEDFEDPAETEDGNNAPIDSDGNTEGGDEEGADTNATVGTSVDDVRANGSSGRRH
ncbi:MAG: VacJ family lipoprotein [Proteobacteria bacterium]|nr:VacJ family lipoprotein [Pseudomonadota bacterium]